MTAGAGKTRRQQATEQNAITSKRKSENQFCGGRVDIRPLKLHVSSNYSKESPLYDAIMADDDFLEPADFVSRLKVWDRLSGKGKR
jgi:hypothetical protein